MSIDPLKEFPVLPFSASDNKKSTSAAPSQPFAEILKSSESFVKDSRELVAQASSLMQQTQLQLLQGLSAVIADSTTDPLLPGSEPLGGLPGQPVGSGQKIDSLYRRLQPTLLERGATDRGEIEQLIDRVAENVSLAPELIRSVVAVESDFDPRALSPAGAQGLMQLMPDTAEELGVENSYDVEQNLLGGSRYLKQLLEKYDGDLDHALAAYNWGQGNVDRKGLAQMPQETRDYLVKVKARLADQSS